MTRLLSYAQIRLMDAFATVRDREEGQGMTEYAVTLVFVVLGAAGIATALWAALGGKFDSITTLF